MQLYFVIMECTCPKHRCKMYGNQLSRVRPRCGALYHEAVNVTNFETVILGVYTATL